MPCQSASVICPVLSVAGEVCMAAMLCVNVLACARLLLEVGDQPK